MHATAPETGTPWFEPINAFIEKQLICDSFGPVVWSRPNVVATKLFYSVYFQPSDVCLKDYWCRNGHSHNQ